MIPKEDFQRCFQQWKNQWAKYVKAQGAYFDGDYGLNLSDIRNIFSGQ